uniref:Putative secreted protein n=1 Tax=Amblyomma cajennense TaxID=34607 RepID=A0A023FE81_AMBCJ
MKVECFLLFITLVIIGNGYSADGYRPGTAFCYPDPRHLPLHSCVSPCYMTNGWTWVHHDGFPCFFYNWGRWSIGQCAKGICSVRPRPRPKPCDNVYRGEGYASNCSYTCIQGRLGTRLVVMLKERRAYKQMQEESPLEAQESAKLANASDTTT